MRMHVSIMDSPGGYICRVRSTPKYEVKSRPSKISSGLLQILQLSLMTKVRHVLLICPLLFSFIVSFT